MPLLPLPYTKQHCIDTLEHTIYSELRVAQLQRYNRVQVQQEGALTVNRIMSCTERGFDSGGNVIQIGHLCVVNCKVALVFS